jgi:hypothetical protein
MLPTHKENDDARCGVIESNSVDVRNQHDTVLRDGVEPVHYFMALLGRVRPGQDEGIDIVKFEDLSARGWVSSNTECC